MASVSLCHRFPSPINIGRPCRYKTFTVNFLSSFPFHDFGISSRLKATRRFSKYKEDDNITDPLYWNGIGDLDDFEETEEEDDERSLDLFVRFVQNVFSKVSKKARKSVRSMLPPSISTKLVGFAVNGLIILSFLWVLKAFLEVVCTLGSIVFVSILLIRGIWSGLSYLQENYGTKANRVDDENGQWAGSQPVT